jgi:hypothetical protein
MVVAKSESARAPGATAVSVSAVTVTHTPHALRIEVHPSAELPRALVLEVNLRPYGATMRAELWAGDAYLMGTGFHRVPAYRDEPHWRLRLGVLAALVLGDAALSVTPDAALVLEAVLVPHGIEVRGGAL